MREHASKTLERFQALDHVVEVTIFGSHPIESRIASMFYSSNRPPTRLSAPQTFRIKILQCHIPKTSVSSQKFCILMEHDENVIFL